MEIPIFERTNLESFFSLTDSYNLRNTTEYLLDTPQHE